MFEEGLVLKKQYGADNVFDFTSGIRTYRHLLNSAKL
jgi:hypothetical protein